jgi:hypothetical protein
LASPHKKHTRPSLGHTFFLWNSSPQLPHITAFFSSSVISLIFFNCSGEYGDHSALRLSVPLLPLPDDTLNVFDEPLFLFSDNSLRFFSSAFLDDNFNDPEYEEFDDDEFDDDEFDDDEFDDDEFDDDEFLFFTVIFRAI